MERFSVFNDPVSGVNPWAPSVVRQPAMAVLTGFVLLAIKAPLMLLVGLLLGLEAAITAAVSASRPRRPCVAAAPRAPRVRAI
jgi:hypothetical protein